VLRPRTRREEEPRPLLWTPGMPLHGRREEEHAPPPAPGYRAGPFGPSYARALARSVWAWPLGSSSGPGWRCRVNRLHFQWSTACTISIGCRVDGAWSASGGQASEACPRRRGGAPGAAGGGGAQAPPYSGPARLVCGEGGVGWGLAATTSAGPAEEAKGHAWSSPAHVGGGACGGAVAEAAGRRCMPALAGGGARRGHRWGAHGR
jgi:hypothetical protein